MKRFSKKSWVSGTVVRKLFPEVEHHSIDALTAVWDEVVDWIISEMMTLSKANNVELHINVREDMVMELARLQFWLAERVVEKRVTGRELSSIDPEQEREECLGPEGADTIRGKARMVHERIWSKRLEERWKPKSAKAIEREANPKLAKLAVKPVGKNHFIPRWFIRDLCIVKTAPPTKSRTYAPLEFRAEDGETPPLCSTLLSSSSHLASVPFGRCVGAAPTWCWRTSLCGSK